MLKIRAYGRDLEIRRDENKWQVFDLGTEGKKRIARDVVIPPSMNEDEIVEYLSDLLHEYASPKHPEVINLTKSTD